MPVGSNGVMIDGLYSVEYAVNNLALPNTSVDTTGATVSSYSARPVIQAVLEQAIAKTGVRIDFYDPVVSAILAGEL